MEGVEKSSSCGASTDGTAAMDVDGVTFVAKRLEDVDVVKTTCCGSSFALEISYYRRRWVRGSDMGIWMVMECGRGY